MAWRTYTPDGRTLDVEFADGNWIATCEGGRGIGTSAAEALARALDDEEGVTALESSTALNDWIEEQAAQLERECDRG
jgi:hypothetical protein